MVQIERRRIGDYIEDVRKQSSCPAEVRAVMSSCDEAAMWDEISTSSPRLSAEALVTDRVHSNATAVTELLSQNR
jgi:hypothetical protein